MTGTCVLTRAQLDTLNRTVEQTTSRVGKVEVTRDLGSPAGRGGRNYTVKVKQYVEGYGFVQYRIKASGERLPINDDPHDPANDELAKVLAS